MDITINSVFFNTVYVDYNLYSERTISALINREVIGRLIQAVSLESEFSPIVVPERMVRRQEEDISGPGPIAKSILNTTQDVILKYDFLPKPLLEENESDVIVRSLAAGRHDVKVLSGLESTCSCICDVTFHNIRLNSNTTDYIDLFELTFEHVSLNVKSDIILLGIGLCTGCPNYG